MLRILKKLPPIQTTLAIVFLLVQTGSSMYLPYLTAKLVDHGIMAENIGFIWSQGAIMMLFTALSLVGALLNMYIAGKIAFGIGKQLRSEIFAKVLCFSKAEYDCFGTSALITRTTNDVTQVQTIVEMVLKFMILSPLYLFGGIFLTGRLNPSLAWVFLAVVPFMAAATLIIYRFATPLYTQMQKGIDKLNLLLREGLIGVKVIRAFSRQRDDYLKYEETNESYTRTAIKAGTIMSVFVPLITLLLNATTIGIIWIGGRQASAGGLEVGSIMAAISYSAQVLMGFGLLTNVILALPRGQVSAIRINQLLDMELSLPEAETPNSVTGEASLEFSAVDFRYANAAELALQDISFSVSQGQTLAVIGGTGDGKTSLINLIPRLYEAEHGTIRLCGTDIRQLAQKDLREQVSLCPQKSLLLMGTVRSNLMLAKPDATEEELWSALNDACISEFVKQLPDGLDSVVEKSGGNFSGGQKQRLCIARALLKKAPVYLFDDSFSALDFKTDAAVRRTLKKRVTEAVTIIVAQRISTIRDADLILVLDKGRVAGLGSHDELAENNLIYQEIMQSQEYKEEAA